ncbi:hypothetical protein [Candidatus Pyrohabitans sp.]
MSVMPPEVRGQISIEFLILIGAIMVMVVAVFPFILSTAELSKAHAAARDGATFAAGMRGLGYRGADVDPVPEGAIRVLRVDMVEAGNYNNLTWYRFDITANAPEYISTNTSYTSSICGTIRTQVLRHVYYAFYGEWPSGSISRVNTARYSFTAGCRFE